MIQRLLDTSEHTRPLVGLGLTSIGQRWMKTLPRTFVLVMYVNVIKLSGTRILDS